MLHPAGETDAGPAGEQPARDSRLGRRMTVEEERLRSPVFHRRTRRRGRPEPLHASENSDWPEPSRLSASLIPEGHLPSSR